MVLQHSSVRKSLLWHINILVFFVICSIRVTAVIEYFESARGCATISHFVVLAL